MKRWMTMSLKAAITSNRQPSAWNGLLLRIYRPVGPIDCHPHTQCRLLSLLLVTFQNFMVRTTTDDTEYLRMCVIEHGETRLVWAWKPHLHWLNSTLLEDSIHAIKERSSHQCYPAMNPESYKNIIAGLARPAQWCHHGTDVKGYPLLVIVS